MKEALEVKKQVKRPEDNIVVSSRGIRLRICPVSPLLVNEVQSKIKKPRIPMWHNPDTDMDQENPNDPDYIEAMEAYERKKSQVMLDTAAMLGIELLDPIPNPETWLKKIKYLVDNDMLDEIDTTDDDALEALYIRYFAADTNILMQALQGLVPEAEIQNQKDSFPGNEERPTDTTGEG